jgi:hypothetical protein
VVTLYGDVFAALHEAGVRNVVVGGVAVVMQGHVRTTVDLGLVIDLAVEPATAAMDALGRLGLLPRIPVEPRAFADESKRLDWVPVRVASVADLIAMKSEAGRPQDEADIDALRRLQS